VEDGDSIVGCWAALNIVHVEGLWIHPDYRKRTAVQRRLWVGMKRLLSEVRSVLTGACDDSIRALITAHDGVEMPTFYRVPLVKESVCQQQ
jgi:hypothetical protein